MKSATALAEDESLMEQELAVFCAVADIPGPSEARNEAAKNETKLLQSIRTRCFWWIDLVSHRTQPLNDESSYMGSPAWELSTFYVWLGLEMMTMVSRRVEL